MANVLHILGPFAIYIYTHYKTCWMGLPTIFRHTLIVIVFCVILNTDTIFIPLKQWVPTPEQRHKTQGDPVV